MNRLDQLLAEANKLRGLDEDDPAKVPLAAMVDEINRIRALPADEQDTADPVPAAPEKRKPGRPRKSTIEGDDA